MRVSRPWVPVLAALSLLGSAAAHAAGFEVPGNGAAAVGRGTAFATGVDDPTAMAYNPGALIRLRGTQVQWSHQLMWAHEKFTRAPSQIPQANVAGATDTYKPLDPVENETPLFPLGAMLFGTTDLGLPDWTFGAGVYGPSASGKKQYPVMGGQRYMITEIEALMFFPSLAASYGKQDAWGIGITVQAALLPQTTMKLVIDGATAGKLNPYYGQNDVEATLDLKDTTARWTAIAGAWIRLAKNFEVSLSGRVLPIEFQSEGTISLGNTPGGATFTAGQLAVTNPTAKLALTLPPTATLGARYRQMDGDREVFDVEANLVYEAWSLLKEYVVDLADDNRINLFADGKAPDVIIGKRWRDTLSVRLGGTYRWNEQLGVSAGGYWEQGAAPNQYSHLDFTSFDRVGLGAGVRYAIGPAEIAVAYAHVFQEDRDVAELDAKVFQNRPLEPCPEKCDGGKEGWSGVPANAGTFETSFDLLDASIRWKF